MDALALLEGQLEEMAAAEHHARWLSSGQVVLVGDVGLFGQDEWQVVAVDGVAGKLKCRPVGGTRSKSFKYQDAVEFVRRGKLADHGKK